MVVDHDLVAEHVHDVGVVPNPLGGQLFPADDDAVDRVPLEPIQPDQRPVIVFELRERFEFAGAPATVGANREVERIRVDADDRPGVVDDRVIDQDRLGATHVDRRRPVRPPPVANPVRVSVGVVIEQAVRDSHVRLVDFDRVETCRVAFDRGLTAGEAELGSVKTPAADLAEIDATPITRGARREPVGTGVERSASAKPVVRKRREDDRTVVRPFRDQRRTAALRLDPCVGQLDDDAGVDHQSARGAGRRPGRGHERSPGIPFDEQVFRQHVRDVATGKPSGNGQSVDRRAELGTDPDEQAVDRVLDQEISEDLRADPSQRVVKAVRGGEHRREVVRRDPVEADRGAGVEHVDRGERFVNRADADRAAAVLDVDMGHVVQKHAPLFEVGVFPKHDPAEIAGFRSEPGAVAVAAERVVVVRTQPHGGFGGSQHLDRRRGAADSDRGGPGVKVGPPHLDQGPRVDHHRRPLRHEELAAVAERRAGGGGADQIRQVVTRRAELTVGAAVAHDTNQIGCPDQRSRPLEVESVDPAEFDDATVDRRINAPVQMSRVAGRVDRHGDDEGDIVRRRGAAQVDRIRSPGSEREQRLVVPVVDHKRVALLDRIGRIERDHDPRSGMGERGAKRIVGVGERSVPVHGPRDRVVSTVDEDRRGGLAGLEPKRMRPAGGAVAAAVDRRPVRVSEARTPIGSERQLQLVVPVGRPAEP